MAFTDHFYHRLMRKYVSLFGNTFNRYTVNRYGNDGSVIQTMPVPISYAPWQKSLARLVSDPDLNRKFQVSLPRMTFEIENIAYDADRRSSVLNKLRVQSEGGDTFTYNPVPYILNFTLNIVVAHTEDGTQLIEQILPFFQPDYVPSVYLIDGIDQSIDIPIVLNSVTSEDIYDNDYETLRVIKWTLNFDMKVFFFGPTRVGKVIKFIDVRNKFINPNGSDNNASIITIQPGMDSNGDPTKHLNETVEYETIDIDDNWDFITQVHTSDYLERNGYIDDETTPEPNANNGRI